MAKSNLIRIAIDSHPLELSTMENDNALRTNNLFYGRLHSDMFFRNKR